MDTMLGLTIIAVIIAIVSTYITYKAWKRKKLSYAILVDTHPIKVSHDAVKNITMTFKGKEVKNFRVVEMKIWNSGNAPIEPNDYHEPITLLPAAAEPNILDAIITKREPANLTIDIDKSNKSRTLSQTLLNPRDAAYIKILLNDYDHPVIPIARISGVRIITEDYPTATSKFATRIAITTSFVFIIGFIVLSIFRLIIMFNEPMQMNAMTVFLVVGIIFVIIFLLNSLYVLTVAFLPERFKKKITATLFVDS